MLRSAPVPPLSLRERWRAKRRFPRRDRGPWFAVAINLCWPFLALGTRLGWRGGEHLPTGGCLVAVNHVSFVDPIVDTAFVLAHGRVPRFLAKAEMWDWPVVGRVLTDGRHIPVQRGGRSALDAYRGAVAALGAGECVVVYPESTYTRRPDGWPMRGLNGVARMALDTGVPVVPVAQWGNQDVLPPGTACPRLLRRYPVRVLAGPPVDLSRFAGRRTTRSDLDAATAQVMAAITELLGQLRGEQPPEPEGSPEPGHPSVA